MEEKQAPKAESKRERQAISVPFQWEERPGTPKKDWKPTPRPLPGIPLPVKLTVSVPFGWEEKPGMPLQPTHEPLFASADCEDFNANDGISSDSDLIETCSLDTDDSFSSAPSLLPNCQLVPTLGFSGAFPVEEGSSASSSYETGSGSLEGASFLEWLFPLLVPKSKSKLNDEIVGGAEEKGFECEVGTGNHQVARPLLTLGEMIAMSRRRSYQRRIVNMRKRTTSMEFMKRNSFGCDVFGIGNGLHKKWKRHLELKLIL